MRTQSDERLVTLARAGSEPAFEAIVARYRRALLRYCAGIVGEAKAEDVVQDAMVRAYVALGRGEDVRTLRPWLYRIAHNTALNHLRDRSGTDTVLDDRLPGGGGPEQIFERSRRLNDAVAAVSALPMRQRDAIVLRELEGRSYDEIAGELGVTRGAARQLLSRARTSVRAGMTALIPVGPLMRFVGPLGDGPATARIAELGGGGAVPKLCAGALAAGAIAGGTGELPLKHDPVPRSPRAATGGSSASGTDQPAPAAVVRTAGSAVTARTSPATMTQRGSASPGVRRRTAARVRGDQPVGAHPESRERRGTGGPRPDAGPQHSGPAAAPSGGPRPASQGPGDGGRGTQTPPSSGPSRAPTGPGPAPGGGFSATSAPPGGLLHR